MRSSTFLASQSAGHGKPDTLGSEQFQVELPTPMQSVLFLPPWLGLFQQSLVIAKRREAAIYRLSYTLRTNGTGSFFWNLPSVLFPALGPISVDTESPCS